MIILYVILKIKTLYFLKECNYNGFSNKSVIITGAGNGIGRIALHYAEKGANVILADIDEKAGAKQLLR